MRRIDVDGLVRCLTRAAGVGMALAWDAAAASTGDAASFEPSWGVAAGLGLGLGVAACIAAAGFGRARRERSLREAVQAERDALRTDQAAARDRRVRHVAAMGREARAGLEALHAGIELLGASRPDPSLRAQLASLRRTAWSLSAQLEHAIDYQAIESGSIQARPERVDAIALLREVASSWSEVAADRRVSFALHVPQHPFPGLRVDPQRLRQIVDALIGAAIVRADRGDLRLELRYRRNEPAGIQGWLVLVVHETGPIPDAAALARMRSAFDGTPAGEPDPASTARSAGGADVAGWRAARLAAALGGSIGSAPADAGATAQALRLPVELDEVSAGGVRSGERLEDLNAAFGRPVLPPGGASRGRLLLVEDDRVVQFAVEHQLTRAGFDVVCAEDADEALALWRAAPVAYVVTDLGLPGRDGVALLRQLRQAERAEARAPARMVVLTGEPDHARRALEAGADAFVEKPASTARLERALGVRTEPEGGVVPGRGKLVGQ